MFNTMENLKLISSSQGTSKGTFRLEGKKTHGFVFRTNGSATFILDDKKLITNTNDMIFLPKGSSYEFFPGTETECRYSAINFEADMTNPKPMVYSLEGFPEASYIFSHFPNLWKFGNHSDRYKCFSLFYTLLAYISNTENLDYSVKRKFELIEPAVSYLKEHIFDSSLTADSLHLICGISDTYFRKIFAAKFAATPQQYIISKRISHAKSLIDNGNFDTISAIAMSVGYNDPLYFSRAFKKKYGVSPANMIKDIT